MLMYTLTVFQPVRLRMTVRTWLVFVIYPATLSVLGVTGLGIPLPISSIFALPVFASKTNESVYDLSGFAGLGARALGARV